MPTPHTRPRQHSPPTTRRSFVWSLGTPVRADLFSVQKFLNSQSEIPVLVRRTTRETIETTYGLLATSRELGARARTTGAAQGPNTCGVTSAAHGLAVATQHAAPATSFSRPCRFRSWPSTRPPVRSRMQLGRRDDDRGRE